ncbi:MAG TPA: hypothetical protein PKW90_18935 [Myxococcota bacterium]|nr:hypothetical protein [Myxococcota bacterium]
MIRRSAAQWQLLVQQWRNSGLSKPDFANLHQLHPATFAWWERRLRSTVPTFVPVVVQETAPPSRNADADLGQGHRLAPPPFLLDIGAVRVHVPHGFDPAELRTLVRVLC